MWPRNLLVLGLTALVIGAGEVRGQWEQDTQTPDQPAPLEGENLDFWDDAELPPIDEDPFSAEDDAFYDVPFDEDDYFYFEDDYMELSGMFDDYCSESFTQFPNATKPCDVRVEGGQETTKLQGGLAGLYVFKGCRNGRPWYQRLENANKHPRYLLFSDYWSDWDFSNRSTLSEESTLGYGGEGAGEWRPELVLDGDWYVRASLTDEDSMLDFVLAPSLKVTCNANCSDGVQNGDETGIDCGGSCPPCTDPQMIARNQESYQRLRRKLVRERSTLTAFQQIVIALLVVFGTFTVCGGPFMYLMRKQKAQMGRARGIASAFEFAKPRKRSTA